MYLCAVVLHVINRFYGDFLFYYVLYLCDFFTVLQSQVARGHCDGPHSRIRDRVVEPSGSPPRETLCDVNYVMQGLRLGFRACFDIFCLWSSCSSAVFGGVSE